MRVYELFSSIKNYISFVAQFKLDEEISSSSGKAIIQAIAVANKFLGTIESRVVLLEHFCVDIIKTQARMKTVKVEFAAEYAEQPEKKTGAVHGMAWTFRSPNASIIYVNENFKVNTFIYLYTYSLHQKQNIC